MNPLTTKQKIILGAVILGVGILVAGFGVAEIFSCKKSFDTYKQALSDYKEGKLQNSYYLFSKISFLSDLKPIAIYRQAKCAEDLRDYDAAIKQYQLLFSNYPNHRLSLRSKYNAARLLLDSRPDLAKKYFDSIIETNPETDYGIASGYFLGKIILNSSDELSDSDKILVRNYYRTYLQKAPSGRWVQNILNTFSSSNLFLESEDYLLMAQSYYLLGDYKSAKEASFHVPLAKSWALEVKLAYKFGDYARVKYLTEYGVSLHSFEVNRQDLYDAIDLYEKVSDDSYKSLSKLYAYPEIAGKDYILNQKCQSAPNSKQLKCYRELYNTFPTSVYSDDALANIFMIQIRDKDFSTAKINGQNYLNKYNNIRYSPMIMYWMGKIAEKTNNQDEYTKYYRGVISRYPDNYYAYRAYLKLNNFTSSIINNYIHEKEVEYPYEIHKSDKLNLKLASLGDFDILFELNDDEFIKSWIYYQKGDYSHSMLVARDAMEKIEDKPDKYDLRWRLVYPIDYYETIKKYASAMGNNSPLILSIVREESYFNPDANSAVGAVGLMQLMPSTAKEIAAKYGQDINLVSDLFNPTLNIKLGNYYYAELKSMLNGLDISSVAAYNGGIGSVNKWKKSLYYNDTDEFVEQIPYPETKDYVKKVFRSYWNYIRIYTGNE